MGRWQNDKGGRAATVQWAKWDHLLGTMPDTALARAIGCSAVNVLKRRTKLGISSYRDAWRDTSPRKKIR